MTFNSYRPFKRKNLFSKFAIVFLLGISFALFFSNALNIVTSIENATQYIENIILTNDWTAKWTAWVILDWNTSWGRVWSQLFCTLDFSKCINIAWVVQTIDLTWFIRTWDLASFKVAQIDPLILNVTWLIVNLSWRAINLESLYGNLSWDIKSLSISLSDYAKLTDLDLLASKTSLDTLSWEIKNISIPNLLKTALDIGGWRTCTAWDIAFAAWKYKWCAVDWSRTWLANLVN